MSNQVRCFVTWAGLSLTRMITLLNLSVRARLGFVHFILIDVISFKCIIISQFLVIKEISYFMANNLNIEHNAISFNFLNIMLTCLLFLF